MSSIVIGVRVRPFNQRELKFNSTNIVAMPTNKPGCVTLKVVRQGKILPDPPKEFNFDHAFWTHDGEGGTLPDGSPATNKWADQQQVFEELGKPVLKNVLEGYNATLFAYGQTGSGKTYTMMGYPPGDVGITPRICDDLFSSLAEMAADADEFQLTTECSYLEIYNEEVHDLLAKERSDHGLKVRQHPKTGVFVEGLKKVIVTQANDVLQILADGNNVRTVASTNMNASSSRSHAVVTLTVGLTMTKNGVIQGKYAKLILVDLAGSERASSTGATGGTLVEGANINKSLSTLGMVLGRLADQAESGGKGLPVPFRDSSLTFLLHDSFGGNSKTAMIANISPADVNYDETLSTLRFAAVTKRVKNKAIVNENPAAKLIRELTEELSGLKEKLANLKQAKISNGLGSAAGGPGASDEEESALAQLIEDGLAAQDSLAVAEDVAAETAAAEEAAAAAAAASAAAENADVIFVDWHKPHLINLCPDSRTLIMTVTAGDAYVVVGDASSPSSNVLLAPLNKKGNANLRINHSPLLNTVVVERLASSVDGAVFINGIEITVGSQTPLEHGDRLSVGAVILRVSHPTNIPTAAPYSRLYQCADHIQLAEVYHRYFVVQRWASELSMLVTDVSEADGAVVEIDGSPRHGESPAAANPQSAIVAASYVDECNALALEAVTDMRHAETELVSQYPVTSSELAAYAKAFQDKSKRGEAARRRSLSTTATMTPSRRRTSLENTVSSPLSPTGQDDELEVYDPMLAPLVSEDTSADQLMQWSSEGHEEYLLAKREQEKALLDQQETISTLKQELEALSRERATQANATGAATAPVAADDDVGSEEEKSAAVERALAAELKWHQEVKLLRNFRMTGPSDAMDAATWRTYAEGAKASFPFLSQLHAEQESYYNGSSAGGEGLVASTSMASVGDYGEGTLSSAAARAFAQRFGRRGTFLKMKQNKEKWDLRYYIIIDRFLYYFHSCVGTFRCLGALYLKGASINYVGAHGGQQHVVLVKLAAPRRADEPKDNSFYFAFVTHKDAALWCHWMSTAAIPEMPPTMAERLAKEAVQQHESGGIKLETHHQFYPVDPLLLGFADVLVTTEGDAALGAWKNDEMVTNCESCAAKFTFFNRRHHCRACGGIFCGTCAPKYGKDNERTCIACQTKGANEIDGSPTAANNEGGPSLEDEDSITVPAADMSNAATA